MASVKVCGSPTSAEVARVLTCLFEKDVEFQLIRVENFKGRERKPDLKLQLAGQALTFEDGSVTLVGKNAKYLLAIIRHIAEKNTNKGNKDLLGSGMLERASIEQWLLTEAEVFDPPSTALVFHLAFAPQAGLEPDEMVVKQSKLRLDKVLNIYEQRLEETRYIAGDHFTLADLSHLPNTHRLITRVPECAGMFRERKRVNKWWEAISNSPSWRMVVEMQKEPPAES